MPTCPRCEETFEAAELQRHERDGIVVVHCPTCQQPLGSYNAHADRPIRRS